jgi:hypothetical protein
VSGGGEGRRAVISKGAECISECILLRKMPAQQLTDSKAMNKARIVSIPFNPSSQQLMAKGGENYSDVDLSAGFVSYPHHVAGSAGAGDDGRPKTPNHITKRQWITVFVLFFVNLINYMDRLTIAGKCI